jgi:hypothetical protein
MKNEFPKHLIAIFSVALASLAFVSLGYFTVHAQSLSYTSGQPVVPGYEGWQEEADGAKYFLFGYMNRNWEEELDISVGADNGFAPGNADQGQPTHFLPRRNRFVFRVRVPQSFSDKDELVWTITSKGKTEKAYASLRADYKVDDVVKASETGALGAGTSSPKVRANKAPIVKIDGEHANGQGGTAIDLHHAGHRRRCAASVYGGGVDCSPCSAGAGCECRGRSGEPAW